MNRAGEQSPPAYHPSKLHPQLSGAMLAPAVIAGGPTPFLAERLEGQATQPHELADIGIGSGSHQRDDHNLNQPVQTSDDHGNVLRPTCWSALDPGAITARESVGPVLYCHEP